jgi:molecular chaperone GrpE
MLDPLNGAGAPGGGGDRTGDAADWKSAVEAGFRRWIEEVESRDLSGPPPEDPPDLYAFYQELAALRSEVRTGARRSHDTFSRFGEALAGFEQTLQALSARLNEDRADRSEAEWASRKSLYLPLVELFERFRRMGRRMARPPRVGRFFGGGAWRKAWSDVEEALEILGGHFEALLRGEGIEAVETEDRPFDPALMTAVDTRASATAEPDTVVEEVSRGYLCRGQVLKLAEVVVAAGRRKETT